MTEQIYKNIPNEFVTAPIYLNDKLKAEFLRKDTIVMSGGGLYFIDYLGLIDNLRYNKILPNIQWAFGSSAGALASLSVILGLDGNEYISNVTKQLKKTYQLVTLNLSSLYRLLTKGYLNVYSPLKKIMIEEMLKMGGLDKNSTFKDLYKKTKKQLVIVCNEFFTGDLMYFSYLTTPDANLYNVLDASSSLVNLFRPIYIPVKGRKSNWYIDGVFSSVFPINATIKSDNKLYYGNYVKKEDILKYDIPNFSTGKVFGLSKYSYWLNNYYISIPEQRNNILNTYSDTTAIIYSSQYSWLTQDVINSVMVLEDSIADNTLSKITKSELYNIYNNGVKMSVISMNSYNSSNGKSFTN